MDHYLEDLNTSKLTYLEFAQLIKKHLTDILNLGKDLIDDPVVKTYIHQLTKILEPYEFLLEKVIRIKSAPKIGDADFECLNALNAFLMLLEVNLISNDSNEIEASGMIVKLTQKYKNVENLKFIEETESLSQLIFDLSRENYLSSVKLLHLERYVNRLNLSNQNLKILLSELESIEYIQMFSDMKNLRVKMVEIYNEFTSYILAMAKSNHQLQYFILLNLLNAKREEYNKALITGLTINLRREKPLLN